VGPMGERDYRSVLESASIERAGRRFAWTIPIVLPVTDAEAGSAQGGRELALSSGGKPFGSIRVDGVFAWNTAELVKSVYGTTRTDHPGARLWLADARTKL